MGDLCLSAPSRRNRGTKRPSPVPTGFFDGGGDFSKMSPTVLGTPTPNIHKTRHPNNLTTPKPTRQPTETFTIPTTILSTICYLSSPAYLPPYVFSALTSLLCLSALLPTVLLAPAWPCPCPSPCAVLARLACPCPVRPDPIPCPLPVSVPLPASPHRSAPILRPADPCPPHPSPPPMRPRIP